ncbi:unnamed protein product, partial [Ectocarpus sp. 12 AP-2014]
EGEGDGPIAEIEGMDEHWTQHASVAQPPGAVLENARSVYSEISSEILTRWGYKYANTPLFSGGMNFSDGGKVVENKMLNAVVEQEGFLAAFTGEERVTHVLRFTSRAVVGLLCVLSGRNPDSRRGKSVVRPTTTNMSSTYNLRFAVRPFFDECACFYRFEAPCPVAPGFRVERLNQFSPAVFLATAGPPFICHRSLHNSR